jgi:hypothetical protein
VPDRHHERLGRQLDPDPLVGMSVIGRSVKTSAINAIATGNDDSLTTPPPSRHPCRHRNTPCTTSPFGTRSAPGHRRAVHSPDALLNRTAACQRSSARRTIRRCRAVPRLDSAHAVIDARQRCPTTPVVIKDS